MADALPPAAALHGHLSADSRPKGEHCTASPIFVDGSTDYLSGANCKLPHPKRVLQAATSHCPSAERCRSASVAAKPTISRRWFEWWVTVMHRVPASYEVLKSSPQACLLYARTTRR